MLSPMVGATTNQKGKTLRVFLDFDFRIGRARRQDCGGYPCTLFRVYLGADAVAEAWRFSTDEAWEWRWLTRAPLWLRGTVHTPMFLSGGKRDVEKSIRRAFTDGLRAYFRAFDPVDARFK